MNHIPEATVQIIESLEKLKVDSVELDEKLESLLRVLLQLLCLTGMLHSGAYLLFSVFRFYMKFYMRFYTKFYMDHVENNKYAQVTSD